MKRLKRLLTLSALLLAGSSVSSAQVTEWVVAKGILFEQTADATPPTSAAAWVSLVQVSTTNPGDATSVTISGGGIVGSQSLVQDGVDWELEGTFTTQAQLNAVVPSATTYTLTLSGGTLGTLVQQALLGIEKYPNAPYLTGSAWSNAMSYNSAAPYTFTWNHPGPVVAASGETIFELDSTSGGGGVNVVTSGAATSATVAAGTLVPNQRYDGQVLFVNDADHTGAFGPGRTGHVTAVGFGLETIAAAQVAFRNAGPNPASYVASPLSIGMPWSAAVDLTTTGHTSAQLLGYASPANLALAGGQRLLVSGVKLFSLPPRPGPIASWSLVVPNDPSMAGVTVYTQAVHLLGVTPFALSNAQDLTLGS